MSFESPETTANRHAQDTRSLVRVDAGLDDWGHVRDRSSAGASSGDIQCSAQSVRKWKTGGGRTWPSSAAGRCNRNRSSGLLTRRCGPLSEATTARIQSLPLEQLEALAEALLDCQSGEDLAAWLPTTKVVI